MKYVHKWLLSRWSNMYFLGHPSSTSLDIALLQVMYTVDPIKGQLI